MLVLVYQVQGTGQWPMGWLVGITRCLAPCTSTCAMCMLASTDASACASASGPRDWPVATGMFGGVTRCLAPAPGTLATHQGRQRRCLRMIKLGIMMKRDEKDNNVIIIALLSSYSL